MTNSYPRDFFGLASWTSANGLTGEEGRIRLAQFAVLCCIAASSAMRECLVFKGGNALDFVWLPNRSTRDLDFSINRPTENLAEDEALILTELTAALLAPPLEHQITLRLHSLQPKPRRPEASFATFRASVGYAFADEPRLRLALEKGRPGSNVVRLDISTNEAVCAYTSIKLDGRYSLLVSTLEDIVAEKLRALLQQQIRNRTREQDLLDLAVLLSGNTELDIELISKYLLRKAEVRTLTPSKSSFADPELARRAAIGYEGLRATTRVRFIEFDEALATLHRLVALLDIPD